MKKILILGSSGMLGHMVYYYLKNLGIYEIVDTSFKDRLHEASILLDVRDEEGLHNLIFKIKPDFIVNCIGILIKGSKTDPSNAIYVNAYIPHRLVGILRQTGGKLIHISTDCVFSGKKGKYSESDFRDADDIYGRSKALGEINNEFDLTLRTSIIGPELKNSGEGLFHWLMNQKGNIYGFLNAFWGGVTTLELAKVIDYTINENITGIVNVTNSEPISKFALLKHIKNSFLLDEINIEKKHSYNSNKSLVTLRNDFEYRVPDYLNMIMDLKSYMIVNQNHYRKVYDQILSKLLREND